MGKKIPGVDVADKCTPAALDLICWSIEDKQAEFLLSKIPGFRPPVRTNRIRIGEGILPIINVFFCMTTVKSGFLE